MLRDLSQALRQLRKRPGFAALAVAILALGIALNTAVFSAVNALIRKPLPFPEASRLALLAERELKSGATFGVSYRTYLDWKRQSRTFVELGAIQERDFNWTGAGEPESVHGGRASVSLLRTLGFKPILGRSFLPEEEAAGRDRVVLLSESFWQRRFSSDRSILGRKITLDGEVYEVVGVLPRIDRSFYAGCRVWLPLAVDPSRPNPSRRALQVVGRLKPGVSFEEASAEMDVLSRRIEKERPDTQTGWRVRLFPMERLSLEQVLPAFLVLMTAVGLVLLIVCANIANLQLARATARRKEVAVRMTLGASRARVIRQLLAEGLLVALAGGALGLLLTSIVRNILIASVPELRAVKIDGTVMGYTLLISCLTGVISGLAPSFAASKLNLNEVLKAEGRGLAGSSGLRMRNVLVVSQMAVALLLSVSSGLLIASFLRMHSADPGFSTPNLITMSVSLPASKYTLPQQRAAFFREAVANVASIPGVQGAAVVSAAPLTGANRRVTPEIQGSPAQPAPSQPQVNYTVAGPGYFQTLRIPLLRGRQFSQQDREGTQPVAIVNDRLAKLYWAGQDPVGKQIKLEDGEWRTVVGVAADTRQILVAAAGPEVFVPHAQDPTPAMSLVFRSMAEPAGVIPLVRGKLRALDADLPVSNIQTMDEIISGYLPGAMIAGSMAFAGIALLLAALGLYGVISYLVRQRTQEIGIRMALGATPGNVRRLVLAQGLRLTALSTVLGLAGAFALTRVLGRVLYGVGASDAGIFAAGALVLSLVGLAASYFPARRATRLAPMMALRCD